jgi:probable rRNA maturation factor
VIDVLIEDPAWEAAEPRAAALAEIAAAAALGRERREAGDLAVLLADDARLAALNMAFRGKDAPTNVLSFPAAAEAEAPASRALSDIALGDIALAFGVCAREAAEQGKSLAHHLQHLTAHGVLHLLGYDHESDAEAEAMEAKERAILAGLGVADPYAPRTR